MSRFLHINDQHTRLFGRRFLNSQLSLWLGLAQLVVCVWALIQHFYSMIMFNKILFCDFRDNSTLPMGLAGVDAIIFDVGLFHSLWGIHGCVAQHLDGGYGRFAWCVCHIGALVVCLPCAFLSRPKAHFLWPLLVQQSAYGIGLLILSLAALPRILPTFMGDFSSVPMGPVLTYVFGTLMNFFLLYVYWHWYWYVEADWNSARKLRPNEIPQPTNVPPNPRRFTESQRKQAILGQPGAERRSSTTTTNNGNGALASMKSALAKKPAEKVVIVDDNGCAPEILQNTMQKLNGIIANGSTNGLGPKRNGNLVNSPVRSPYGVAETPTQRRVSVMRLDERSATMRKNPDDSVTALIEPRKPSMVSRAGLESPVGSTTSSGCSSQTPRRRLPAAHPNTYTQSAAALALYRRQQQLASVGSPGSSQSSIRSISQHSRAPKIGYETGAMAEVHQRPMHAYHSPRASLMSAPHSSPINGQHPSMTPINIQGSAVATHVDVLPRTLAQARLRQMRRYQSTDNYRTTSYSPHYQRALSQSARQYSFVEDEDDIYDRVHSPTTSSRLQCTPALSRRTSPDFSMASTPLPRSRRDFSDYNSASTPQCTPILGARDGAPPEPAPGAPAVFVHGIDEDDDLMDYSSTAVAAVFGPPIRRGDIMGGGGRSVRESVSSEFGASAGR